MKTRKEITLTDLNLENYSTKFDATVTTDTKGTYITFYQCTHSNDNVSVDCISMSKKELKKVIKLI